MSQTPAPTTYADWLPLLDRFSKGDNQVLDAMMRGRIEWTNVVAERWTARLTAANTERLQAISKALQVAINRSAGDPFAISRAMLDARRSLVPLLTLSKLSCAPADLQQHLADEITRFAVQTQESLEKSAKEIRNDNGRILKAFRDNPLTSHSSAEVPQQTPPPPSGDVPAFRARRTIL